jgi:hypothetical protein
MWTPEHARQYGLAPWDMDRCSTHELRLMRRHLNELRQTMEEG